MGLDDMIRRIRSRVALAEEELDERLAELEQRVKDVESSVENRSMPLPSAIGFEHDEPDEFDEDDPEYVRDGQAW